MVFIAILILPTQSNQRRLRVNIGYACAFFRLTVEFSVLLFSSFFIQSRWIDQLIKPQDSEAIIWMIQEWIKKALQSNKIVLDAFSHLLWSINPYSEFGEISNANLRATLICLFLCRNSRYQRCISFQRARIVCQRLGMIEC